MTLVRLMNEVMRGYQDEFVQVYLDDIVVFSKNEHEHQAHLPLKKNPDHIKKNCWFDKYLVTVHPIRYLSNQ